MTSYEFEKAAKNAVIQTLSEDISIDQLDLVWFAHELGYEIYVDIYQKIINNKISSDEFNFEA